MPGLSDEVGRLRGFLAASEEALAQRLRALSPAPQARLARRVPTWLEALRLNGAMHADALDTDVPKAGDALSRCNQRLRAL